MAAHSIALPRAIAKRSLEETAMCRFKKILGDKIASRKLEIQVVEVRLKTQILNRMTQCGMPISYKIG
jgi:hypothetical protein